jgi:uncharacterized protein (DUF1697 family)
MSIEGSRLSLKKPETYVALLRGINVGGTNKVPMKDLSAIFVAAGCSDVRTYIQSGNVVCKAPAGFDGKLASIVEGAILGRFGLRIPVVMRTAIELCNVSLGNPFLKAGREADKLHVAFLADLPNPARVAALDADRSPPDEFLVKGREVYLFLPGGVAKTKLTNAYFDATLGTKSTVRNWRTVGTLASMV